MTVLVECYPDHALLRTLGVPKRQLRHERCKGEVVKKIRKLDEAIGIVDEDPTSAQPRDLANYDTQAKTSDLRLLARRDGKDRRIVLICPRLEDWLIRRAHGAGVRPQDYGLPDDPRQLHGLGRYDRKETFQRFLTELIACDSGMAPLRQWVIGR